MKLRNYLENIVGIGIYPVISLVLFFLFFSILAVWVLRTRRAHFGSVGQLPLDDTDQPNQTTI